LGTPRPEAAPQQQPQVQVQPQAQPQSQPYGDAHGRPYAAQQYTGQQYPAQQYAAQGQAAQPYDQSHPALPATAPAAAPQPQPQNAAAEEAWPGICEQFSQQVLLLAEQLRPAMDRLETEEDDPDRLQLLYQVDHAVTRMRRAARELRVLAGSGGEELDGHTTSLVDIIRMAESSIERYTQTAIGKVVQLAVVAYAAEDVAAVVVALLDNATRYSPSTVTVSAHLLDNGAVMMRIEDTGIGIEPERVRALNELLAGPVPPLAADTGRHTGFAVVHRLARKHDIGVSLACRPVGNAAGAEGGTVAMVVIPPALLCEIPGEVRQPAAGPGLGAVGGHGSDHGLAHLTMAHRAEAPERPRRDEPHAQGPHAQGRHAQGPHPEGSRHEEPPGRPAPAGGLPRRESMSLRRGEAEESAPPRREREPAPRDPAAAALAFAADIEAFSAGGRAASAEDGTDDDTATQDAGDATEGPSA
jgi:anti-sigma regulatory factor (Ser/Thr protein kinase)